jgi:hypothetical protein
MNRTKLSATMQLVVLTLCLVSVPIVSAHGPVDRSADLVPVEARLFAGDNRDGSIIVVDLPSADTVRRLSTPPFIMSVGWPGAGPYVYILRGRNTDRDFVTVIDSGFEGDGQARPPFIARSFVPGAAPGGTDQGRLLTIGGRPSLFMDDDGELVVFEGEDFGDLGEIPVRRYPLAGKQDHLHLVETDEYLYIGYLMKGIVQIVEKESGNEVKRIEGCPILYGATADKKTGRAFFSCHRDVLVVGTRGEEMHQVLGRIQYPSRQRIGPFLHGRDRVIWGYTESSISELQRLDLKREPYVIESLPVDSSIQQNASPDGKYLLVYTRNGMLDIRDGGTGELIDQIRVSRPFDQEYHEHVDKALLPDIRFLGGRVYISLPHEGRIAELTLDPAEVLRYIDVGGEPTRMVAMPADLKAPFPSRHSIATSIAFGAGSLQAIESD